MIRSHTPQQQNPIAIDLTALLDIIFIVLVFLLLTANMPLRQMNIDLPQVDNAQPATAPASHTMTLNLFADPPYWGIDEQRYSDWDQFRSQITTLAASSTARPEIVIITDRNARNENLLNLLNLLQQQQIPAAHILTKGTP
ncbi:biopolymer transporter ExbD [Serratia sp. DD3]|uniref:ExbD/TolR family protein n=1 Tax=Serratia sp. DD3 TaxID=1410619 RepID=UPI0003C51113|nr:biopolymer transporter ExbD [Serratia sp. DD3]KEY60861.1 protein TolR [Serratia sp. DD3]